MNTPVRHMPENACDTHVHLFGPPERYPFAESRVYTPGDAHEAQLFGLHNRLGIDRVVLVQPSVYGTDNRRMLAGLANLGGKARGIAVIDASISDATLEHFHTSGVRGVRVNIATHGMNDPGEAWKQIAEQAKRVTKLGWHIQVLTRLSVISALAPRLRDLGSLVIDHFGLPDFACGIEQPGFEVLCELVSSGSVMVKLSAIERLCESHALSLATPFVRALVEANAKGVVWGSDWPHTGGGRSASRPITDTEPFQDIDDQHALECLFSAIPQQAFIDRILVVNPACLYDFPEASVAT